MYKSPLEFETTKVDYISICALVCTCMYGDDVCYTNYKKHVPQVFDFDLCLGFTAQSTQWGHVERGQFT